jgi:hypothetical protein
MDAQKMSVRADLERMVLNYLLMGRIENREADQIISCLDRAIGYAPAPEEPRRGKVIPFPKAATGEGREHKKPPEPEETPWEQCQKISDELGLRDIKYLGSRILNAISKSGVKSVEELAELPLVELSKRRGIGEKAVSVIREALKSKGYALSG